MGSISSLDVGQLQVTWGKNEPYGNHSALFLKGDIQPAIYYYADDVQESQPAYVRKLGSVIKRLDLLGFSLPECRRIYDGSIERSPDCYTDQDSSFETLRRVVASIDVNRVALAGGFGTCDLGQLAAELTQNDPDLTGPIGPSQSCPWREFLESLHPYLLLRLLGENRQNLEENVVWRFHDVLEGGWVEKDCLYVGLADVDKYLVVTEGSSDSSILRAALPLVEPDVADFFDFVDMSENYPFTGTGNLVRFCQGLARLRIQNKILVVLDNDTAGLEAFQRIRKMDLPRSMHLTVLPSLDELANFKTLGPSGESTEDINGRAVSIELFLDLRYGSNAEAAVRWTSFNAAIGAYQGELIRKENYARAFFDSAGRDPTYDLGKMKYLWNHLLTECAA